MVHMIRLKSREEWLKHRDRIGGSDAAAIVGMNPYKNNVELWQIKTGQVVPEDISDKPYVKYGTEAEQYLRELFKLDFPEYQVEYVENNMFFRRGVWECKTTQIQHPGQKRKWDGRIPDNYYIQILHYLMVTEFDFVVLKAQLKYDFGENVFLHTKHYKIERADVETDIRYLESAERDFWKQVQERRKPALILPEI